MTTKMSDSQLYKLCRKYGRLALRWRWKFMGLLPEVFSRRLYARRGFCSIYEFAARLAGVSKDQVNRALCLAKKFENLPRLKELFENGKVSMNKLARMAGSVTPETEEAWAIQAHHLSVRAVEALVKDVKYENKILAHDCEGEYAQSEEKNGLFEPKNDGVDVHVNGPSVDRAEAGATGGGCEAGAPEAGGSEAVAPEAGGCEAGGAASAGASAVGVTADSRSGADGRSGRLDLSAEVTEKLLELKSKGIDINREILEFLRRRETEIEEQKQEIILEQELRHDTAISLGRVAPRVTRHIPAAVKRILDKEFGTKCAVKNCNKRAEEIHHSNHFALSRVHDPRFMAPLCKGHHEIVQVFGLKYMHNKRDTS